MVSVLHVEPLFRNLDGLSSQEYNKSPPPFEFLSNLYGVQNPFNLNWAEENESSNLVSEISNMSILVSMMKDNASNLFLIELIFKWPTIIFSGHWIFISLSPIFGSTILLCLVLLNEFGILYNLISKHYSVLIKSECRQLLIVRTEMNMFLIP